jgi:hypothetical protein
MTEAEADGASLCSGGKEDTAGEPLVREADLVEVPIVDPAFLESLLIPSHFVGTTTLKARSPIFPFLQNLVEFRVGRGFGLRDLILDIEATERHGFIERLEILTKYGRGGDINRPTEIVRCIPAERV